MTLKRKNIGFIWYNRRLGAQLPDTMRRNNEINSSWSLKEHVIGIITV